MVSQSTERLNALRAKLPEYKVDVMLITHQPNIRYLIGFTGSSGVLIVAKRFVTFITDGRYDAQARQEVQGARIRLTSRRRNYFEVTARLLKRRAVDVVGIESAHVSVEQFDKLRRLLRESGLRVRKVTQAVEFMRAVKDDLEIEMIRRAADITDAAFEHALQLLRPGMRERDIALEIQYFMQSSGADDVAFHIIVASGKRSAMAHGTASDKVIRDGELVVFDMGAVYKGYHADLTRTVAVGKASHRQRRMYRAVWEAQMSAVETVRAGVPFKKVERTAQRVLRKWGYLPHFKHGIGHGVGLEIHELPSPHLEDGGELVEGNVITVEPGIYIEGYGGVRIEDMVVARENGCEVITRAPKPDELLVV